MFRGKQPNKGTKKR